MGFARSHLMGHRADRVLFRDGVGHLSNARLVSPRIPESGEVDLQRFHSEEGRKYLLAYTILGVATVVANAVLGQAAGVSQWSAQNLIIAPMTIATGVAAIFIRNRLVQILALVIQIGGWIWYFAALQTALSGWMLRTDWRSEVPAALALGCKSLECARTARTIWLTTVQAAAIKENYIKSVETKKWSPKEREELLATLQARFEKNMSRHKELSWAKVKAKLERAPQSYGRSTSWKRRAASRT